MLRAKNGGDMPTMRPVSMGRPLVTMSTYEERGETLKRTSIMPDESCYRNNNNTNNNNSNNNNNNNNNGNNGSNRMSVLNGNNNSNNNSSNNNLSSTPELPPPPPQFANPQQQQQPPQSQLKLSIPNGNGNGNGVAQQQVVPRSKQLLSPVRSPSINVGGLRAPVSPQPDYEAGSIQLRSNGQTAAAAATTTTTSNGSQQQRRTLRLGAVTIGEYGEQRGKRETLRKVPSIGSGNGNSAQTNGILKNGNRSSASFNTSSSNNNSNSNGISSNSNGRQQLQQPEKSIKFGN